MKSQELLADSFGSLVFSDQVMRLRLPGHVYEALHRTIEEGEELDAATAEVIASVMKEWALERGATHYTHWFQPMSGQSAEKQEAFITPHSTVGAILEFSGRALIRGEADASSFPSGGLRATFEARGYTAWDCTSPAFVRADPDGGIITLCIPTAFCSYTGEALDTRTPLLRAREAINKQALRILRALGDTKSRRVTAQVGIEQEYFLIDRELYRQRRDLIYTGRTLFGANPPKGQEMEDQYYAAIRQRVSLFMAELNKELWKLGIAAKTQHNEVAPAQHEVAVVYDDAVAACDQNQLTMMLLRKVAARQGMAAQLHEKPFSQVSGSGKHNNWSLATDRGENLLDPGAQPKENLRFLLFFCATIAGVDAHPGLIRAACASASNDHRLCGHEAPIPLLSVYIGEELLHVLQEVCGEACDEDHHHASTIRTGVSTMPKLDPDHADRNRTSPFAFTGNKFELRMVGSSQSTATVNAVLGGIIADQLEAIATRLEGAEHPAEEAWEVVRDLFRKHRKVIFNGNNYAPEWEEEAKRRKLPYFATTVEAIAEWNTPATEAMFKRQRIFSAVELESRVLIQLDAYIKTLRIEGNTMLEMQRRYILPAGMEWQCELAGQVTTLKAAGANAYAQQRLLDDVSGYLSALYEGMEHLEKMLWELPDDCTLENAAAWRDSILPLLGSIWASSDALEEKMPRAMWPVPTTGELLFHV